MNGHKQSAGQTNVALGLWVRTFSFLGSSSGRWSDS